METQIPTVVVDWLNEQGIQPGPYVENGKWTVANLKGVVCDPKLHGTRLFRHMISTQIFGTGGFKRQPNPEPERNYVPELAHMSLEEQTSMLAAVGWELDWGNRITNRPSPRRGMPRYKTLWPGNAAQCFACTGRMVISGDHLRCPKCLKVNGRTCWNRVEVPLELIRGRVHAWLMEQLRFFPKVRNAFVDAAWGMLQERRRKTVSSAALQQKEIDRLQAECAKLIAGIKIGGNLESLVAELAAVEQQLKKVREKMSQKDDADDVVTSCGSKQDVESRMGEVLWHMMNTSYEFNDVMRRFFPKFIIQPVQALDSGQVHPRGKLRFQTDASSAEFPDGEWIEVVMDFFHPPVHIGLLPQIMEERSKVDPKTGRVPSYKKIGDKVVTSYMTVKRALAYSRLMAAEGLKDPFRELTEPPRKASRWLTREKPRGDEAA